MTISPVSFKSLMVFTLNDGKPYASIPELMRVTFAKNKKLQKYHLNKDVLQYSEVLDDSVHNSKKNLAQILDAKYKSILPKGDKKVILTEAEFCSVGKNNKKKYFLTAATDKDEKYIHKILSKSSIFYCARFNYYK